MMDLSVNVHLEQALDSDGDPFGLLPSGREGMRSDLIEKYWPSRAAKA
jgi:hypothetical protein